MSFRPQFTTNPMTAAITRIERARGFLEAAQFSPNSTCRVTWGGTCDKLATKLVIGSRQDLGEQNPSGFYRSSADQVAHTFAQQTPAQYPEQELWRDQ